MIRLFNQYPAKFLGVVQAVLGLLLAFGVPLTVRQFGAIEAVAAAAVAWIVHQKVTPVDTTSGDTTDA